MSTQFVSASKLKSYRLCPFRTKNEPFKTSEAMSFGTSVHSGIAKWLLGGDFLAGYRAKALELKVPVDFETRAIDCFHNVQEHPKLAIDRDSIITVESEDCETVMFGNRFFEVQVEPGVWGLRGGMDLVDMVTDEKGEPRLRILDWKTGMGEEDDNLQLACYALASYFKYPGFPRIETAFFYLEKGSYIPFMWDEKSLEGALEGVSKWARKYLAEKEWPRTPNKYCSYCTLNRDCEPYNRQLQQPPHGPTFLDIEATPENFPEIMSRLAKIEALSKAADGIKFLLSEKRDKVVKECGGSIQCGDTTWTGREKTTTYSVDVAAVFSQVEETIGRPPWEILKFDSGAFAKMRRGIEDKVARSALTKILHGCRSVATTTYEVKPSISKNVPPAKDSDEEEPETVVPVPVTQAAPALPAPAETAKPQNQAPASAPAPDPAPVLRMDPIRFYVCQGCSAIEESSKVIQKCRHCSTGCEVKVAASLTEARGFVPNHAPNQVSTQSV